MAQANAKVRSDVIEVTEFPELTQRYDITTVPKTVINERFEIVGAVSEGRFMDEVLRAQEE